MGKKTLDIYLEKMNKTITKMCLLIQKAGN